MTNDTYQVGGSCSEFTCRCPENYFRITDEISCGRAALAMGKNFTGVSFRKPAPSGCFDSFDALDGTSNVEFADGAPTWKDDEGMPIQSYSLLCATGVSPCQATFM